jgi:hypothetical protein
VAHGALEHGRVRQRDCHDAVNARWLSPARALSPRSRVLASALLSVALALCTRRALGADKRAEVAARAALKTAVTDYVANDYTQGLITLRKASKACAPDRCSPALRAELLRDTGVLQLADGQSDKAAASFLEALVTDPSVEWNPAYDHSDLRAEWEAAQDEAKVFGHSEPTGDFVTTPPSEQVVRTAIPVYVEYGGKVANVVVKYKATRMSEFKRVRLSRLGKGWGGEIPCTDVVRGVVRYYVQGFDEDDTPVAITGDPRHPLFVPVRASISSPAPHLPGKEPPAQCAASGECPSGAACGETHGEEGAPTLDNGEVCEANGQCTSGRCASGRCAPERSPHGAGGGYVHFWFGVSASVDVTVLPGASNVCALTPNAVPSNSAGYYCTTPFGADFPSRSNRAENDSLVKGQSGETSGGLESGDVRLLLSFDYAVSANALLGARFGLVLNGYPGVAAAQDGHGLGAPLHLEARGTWLFGDRPLAHSGFAPLLFVAGGIGEFDASTSVGVLVTGVPGPRPFVAWKTAGPGFAALGVGLRYAFSPRVAFSMALKASAAFGGGFLPVVAPEVGLQYGF